MKTTIRAVLLLSEDSHNEILDNMMLVFCTAVRRAFKRILEHVEVGDIEKSIASQYGLNSRQSKDAVESARQIVASQKELLKINHANMKSKVEKIQRELNMPMLTPKKRSALLKKLDKRMRKLEKYQQHIKNDTIPSVVFGGKKAFYERCKGNITREEWRSLRNNRFYSRGDKSKGGNPNLRVVVKDAMTFLEVSTLEKVRKGATGKEYAVKIRIPLYLPHKLSKKSGKVNGRNYRQHFLDFLSTGEAYQVEMLKKNDKYYVHITFDEPEVKPIYTGHIRMLGADTNPDGFAATVVDRQGNYIKHTYIGSHELLYARSSRRDNICGELAMKLVKMAKSEQCGIAAEDLAFKDDKDVKAKFARIKNQFAYSKMLRYLERACNREGVELQKVKPAFTSIIGLYKYCHQYGVHVHSGAAMVIARRSYGYDEKVPKPLVDRFVKNKEPFLRKNQWTQWSDINKSIKKEMKGGNPGLWLERRKEILGLTLK